MPWTFNPFTGTLDKIISSSDVSGLSRVADLSSQCDGVNVTFNMPEGFTAGSVSLQGTQFPLTYRPVIDFTEDTDSQTITLTLDGGTFGPPQTGHTLVARYEKNTSL